jgi:histidyl-tRNA synthetase
VEVYHDSKKKTKQQIQYANKKGIRYIAFVSDDQTQVKDLTTGEQSDLDLAQWTPDRSDSYQTQIIASAKSSIRSV